MTDSTVCSVLGISPSGAVFASPEAATLPRGEGLVCASSSTSECDGEMQRRSSIAMDEGQGMKAPKLVNGRSKAGKTPHIDTRLSTSNHRSRCQPEEKNRPAL